MTKFVTNLTFQSRKNFNFIKVILAVQPACIPDPDLPDAGSHLQPSGKSPAPLHPGGHRQTAERTGRSEPINGTGSAFSGRLRAQFSVEIEKIIQDSGDLYRPVTSAMAASFIFARTNSPFSKPGT